MKLGELLVVIGQVGCGKTSLLCSVMEETICQKGTRHVAGSIAYVEQEPFIFSDTVKENILFRLEEDSDRLLEAIKVS